MAIPAPYVFPPSLVWEGNDGVWSTFYLSVGSKGQWIRVLPDTYSPQLLLPLPESCDETRTNINTLECGSRSGVSSGDGFDYSESSTWDAIGDFLVGGREDIGYTGSSLFGLDNIGLDNGTLINGSGLTGLQLPDHLVAGVTGPGPFLGLFGLGPGSIPTDDSTSYPGAMQDLMDRSEIPSRSFGYTAGAYYSKSPTQRYICMADSFLRSSTKFRESHTRWL